ncbi:hypothetical protein Cgig2_005061 [Carnegiea gigantea]|uniref:BHLH domain-containing protein n=1 Tax=Carnegiea gigantea TaxID=171969 RepID=A0A9Q1L140_9CARY|nr:hypothetical protein Cgig2_005061 [Carnegiea gigantea]
MSESISNSFFNDPEFGASGAFSGLPASPDDLFSIFEALEGLKQAEDTPKGALYMSETELDIEAEEGEGEGEGDGQPKRKKVKTALVDEEETRAPGGGIGDGSNRISHITVERNRRKQMNEHLTVLRSLMPCFYGDQASIIGGVVDYINELQQVLQSLEAKKQRKVYSEVLSPRLVSSPRPSPQVLSPRSRPPLSPRLNIPISPRTPQPSSPYRPRLNLSSPVSLATPIELSPASSSSSLNDPFANELIANSKSPMAEVEVKFSGPNVLVKTVSPRIPGQVVKIISALEDLSLEILHISISTIEDTMLNSFTIKIGIECQLSAEELAHQIQQTFCSPPFIIN